MRPGLTDYRGSTRAPAAAALPPPPRRRRPVASSRRSCFVYCLFGSEVLSLLTFACMRATSGELVVHVLTTQADNQRARELTTVRKGLGDEMFSKALVPYVRARGGGVIYAECVTRGVARSVWDAHPMQESNIGNFLWLQLGMAKPIDSTCLPKTLRVRA